jgi:type IV pilus assembly protein PilB
MNNPTVSVHRGLPKRLIEENVISAEDMMKAVDGAKEKKMSLLSYIFSQGTVEDDKVAEAAAREFGMPVYNLDDINVEELSGLPKEILDRKFLRKHLLLPLFVRDKRLYVATADPSTTKGLRELQFQARMPVEPVLVSHSKLIILRTALLDNAADNLVESLNINSADYDVVDRSESFNIDPDAQDTKNTELTPIVRFINKMIINAVTVKASDIHFEPYDQHYRVRFRVDGILREIFKPPSSWSSRLVSRIKIMANLDITERRIPQDGRIRVTVAKDKSIDLRVNTLPMQFGEKVVMRILDPASTTIGIDKLGYEDDQRAAFLSALGKSQGMILVTGPTGSGKTVSLYTGLNILNTDERNISTAEDPVEINIAGINQTQINLRVGFDFPTTLRAFLRQDPDVIMVGEIRDLETAEIAVTASQTGHLVLSTLHPIAAPKRSTDY